MAKYGYNLSKILEIFANGFMLNMTRDKHMRFKLHQKNDKIWHEIDKKILYRTLEKLRLNKIVDITKEGNIEKCVLTKRAKHDGSNTNLITLPSTEKNLGIKNGVLFFLIFRKTKRNNETPCATG